ncbi:acylglycerol kinase, mitochondrial [Bombus pascuorum]|uniref:acylglycerol kinase, mitochondrial n=1 Tax=Bombus pascuorum TaxID=65598 RepID=UPI00213CCFC6|nr:acylglycerol kinase, mitochondrial [Bombus pascuorum]XP_060821606.1 acylglycerol kinase, mitochondrial [Bombus pascuorum]XP_060821607.1 acylglycerol kinase, mitochondrial [Bombus pascuorum]
MAKILSFFRTIRNNWKKSLVACAAVTYGISYGKEVYDANQLMRQYCESVSQYGDFPLPTNIKPRHVTIILNPTAKKGKAKKLFQNYCEPLLHLAGIAVTVIQTDSQNDARKIIMDLDTPTDAIIVAGGDGTLSDVLTGLVRKYDLNLNLVKQCPIGILPLGQTNKIAKSLYHEYDDLSDIKQVIEATMAIIHEKSKMMDMIEVKAIDNNPEEPAKPIYAMGTVEWGVWKDANASANKYWYWGFLRKYVTYVFNGYEENLNKYCDAVLKYTLPCEGCSRCSQNNLISNLNTRWWHVFLPRYNASRDSIDFSKRINEKCDVLHELPISTCELHVATSNIDKLQVESSPPSLKVKIGPKDINYFSFVSEGWKKEKSNKSLCNQIVEAKKIELTPQKTDKNHTLYIDNEEYELKAVEIKLLSQAVKVFSSELNS